MLSVFITPWMKPDQLPARDERGLPLGNRLEQRERTAAPRPRAAGRAGCTV
jgi:hypothetical protein